jgi:hypothetical protein
MGLPALKNGVREARRVSNHGLPCMTTLNKPSLRGTPLAVLPLLFIGLEAGLRLATVLDL